MAVNADKPTRWKQDIARSVDFYNDWFITFAPKAFRDTRSKTIQEVEGALKLTNHLKTLNPAILRENPDILPMLRMSTAPPIARDRLIGLAAVSPNLVKSMEVGEKQIPPRMDGGLLNKELGRIINMILRLADQDIFNWLENMRLPSKEEAHRAATIVADRLCGAVADPIVRNAQQQRQVALIRAWLEKRKYTRIEPGEVANFLELPAGSFVFNLNVPVKLGRGMTKVNIPIDAMVMPKKARLGGMPLLIEAKSAGDFTNTNKRRKEEAVKIAQLRSNYGKQVRFILFLCGYFDSGYLGYEAAEGIDWVWEHRVDDLASFGL
ncbi:MAG: XamI family restriction endonuclease [Elusimicrobia bacterium]|nr:XamI family restriction endonuclease [Elusimicrobiota bacterium]